MKPLILCQIYADFMPNSCRIGTELVCKKYTTSVEKICKKYAVCVQVMSHPGDGISILETTVTGISVGSIALMIHMHRDFADDSGQWQMPAAPGLRLCSVPVGRRRGDSCRGAVGVVTGHSRAVRGSGNLKY